MRVVNTHPLFIANLQNSHKNNSTKLYASQASLHEAELPKLRAYIKQTKNTYISYNFKKHTKAMSYKLKKWDKSPKNPAKSSTYKK